ncbi:MAG: toll/interleukin-1 receptor domain-containing protein [Thermoleophilia bacterium]
METTNHSNSRKVFISHSGLDKERFVVGFATKLCANGVDAWFDKWDLLPGDSLVRKIFEEGIKGAKALIIVLSHNSVSSKWVREELDTAVIKRINEDSKIIPVVIDNCEIPECLKATVWIKIADTTNYDDEFERILMSIFGHTKKPPIGKPPVYATTDTDAIDGLSKTDTIVFRTLCSQTVDRVEEDNALAYVHVLEEKEILDECKSLGILDGAVQESLAVLDRLGLAKIRHVTNTVLPRVSVTEHGLGQYLRLFIDKYEEMKTNIVAEIVNKDANTNMKIVKATGFPVIVVNHVLRALEMKKYVMVSKNIGAEQWVHIKSPDIRRLLE